MFLVLSQYSWYFRNIIDTFRPNLIHSDLRYFQTTFDTFTFYGHSFVFMVKLGSVFVSGKFLSVRRDGEKIFERERERE